MKHECSHDHCHHDSPNASWLATLLPVLACALCPAHLAMIAQALSVVGLGFSLDETTHTLLLVIAVGTSVAITGWRAMRERIMWPAAVALLGALLVISAHVAGEVMWLEWLGIAALLGAALGAPWAARRARRQALATA